MLHSYRRRCKKSFGLKWRKCYLRFKIKSNVIFNKQIKLQKKISRKYNNKMLKIFRRFHHHLYRFHHHRHRFHHHHKLNRFWHLKLRIGTPFLFQKLLRNLRYRARQNYLKKEDLNIFIKEEDFYIDLEEDLDLDYLENLDT